MSGAEVLNDRLGDDATRDEHATLNAPPGARTGVLTQADAETLADTETLADAPSARVAAELRALAAWEIASVASSIVVGEWAVLAYGQHKTLLAVPVVCAFALMFYSHRLRGETPRELGWRTDNFLHAARLLLPLMLAGTLVLVLVGWLWFGGSFSFGRGRAGWAISGFPVWGLLWGLLQQHVLQAFINRRAQLVCGRGAKSIVLVAAVFALLHLPNPWLMGATFLGGLIWAAVYQRAPNLYALALSHAFLTWALISTLPGDLLRGLRVGYKFFG